MKKVLYVTTVSRTINAFLIPHINMLLDNGYEIHCACSIDKPVDKERMLQVTGVGEHKYEKYGKEFEIRIKELI